MWTIKETFYFVSERACPLPIPRQTCGNPGEKNVLPKVVELACCRLRGILILCSILFLLHCMTSLCNAVFVMTQEPLTDYSLESLLLNSTQPSRLFTLIIKVGLDMTCSGQTAHISSPFPHIC